MMKEPLPVGDIGALLDLRRTPQCNAVDVVHFVRNLRTVLVSGSGIISNGTIPRLHKSFVEFITSERADPQFRIDALVVDGQIAMKCLQLISRSRDSGERSLLPTGSVRYSIQNWTKHLPGEKISGSGVGVVGGADGLSRVLSTTAGLRKALMLASGDYRTHMYDPKIGLPLPPAQMIPPQYGHSSTFQGSSPIFAIAVSSDGKFIASGDEDGVVQVWDSKSHEPIGKAGKHLGIVGSICFAPDSCWLVSGGWDMTVRMWDCGTGQAIGTPLLGHTNYVFSVCTDGQRISSGGNDGTIWIWSCETRQLIGEPIKVGKFVIAVALSNNGRIAVGVDQEVCVFDIETRQQIGQMKDHSSCSWVDSCHFTRWQSNRLGD